VAVALRGSAAIVFVIVILLMPQPTLASLVLLFAAYLAADGLFAILVWARALARRALARLLIPRAPSNLGSQAWSLALAGVSAVPFLHLGRRLGDRPTGGTVARAARRTLPAHKAAVHSPCRRRLSRLGLPLPIPRRGITAAASTTWLGWLAAYVVLFGAGILALA